MRKTRSTGFIWSMRSLDVFLLPVFRIMHPVTAMMVLGFSSFVFFMAPTALSSDFWRTEQVLKMIMLASFSFSVCFHPACSNNPVILSESE